MVIVSLGFGGAKEADHAVVSVSGGLPAPSGTSASETYLYDADGNQVLTTSSQNGTPTDTISFDNYTETVISGGSTTTTKYYSINGQRLAERVGGATIDYLVSDLLGNQVLAINNVGSVIAVQLYEPYGQMNFSWCTMPTAHNYTGQRLDSQSGLLSYNFRWYDPLSRQFVRTDTKQTNAQGFNPYAYVNDNPETRNDPTGHWGWGTLLAVVAVVVVVAAVAVVAAPVVIAAAGAAAEVAADGAVDAATARGEAAAAGGDAAADACADAAADATADTATNTATDVSSEAGDTSNQITLYCGASNVNEINAFNDSGHIMSDAARTAYMESRYAGASVQTALSDAQAASDAA